MDNNPNNTNQPSPDDLRSTYGSYGSYGASGAAGYTAGPGYSQSAAYPAGGMYGSGNENFGSQSGRPAAKSRSAQPLGMKRSHFTILIVIIICGMLGTGIAGGVIGSHINNTGNVIQSGGSGSNTNLSINTNDNINTTEAVAAKVLDSVVGITTTFKSSSQDYWGFGNDPQVQTGVGTGMIVDSRGYILTNSHVVLDGSMESIAVLLSDGTTVKGDLLWNDPNLDLAIVKIDPAGKNLKPVELGESNSLALGQYVAAIGNPLGLDFNSSITAGVISGLDRIITASDGTRTTQMEGLIQVDAAINSGNSGGPLLNSKGQVIGINTAKAQSAEGMGFAIPIDTAKPIIDSVIKTGHFERVYIGVSAGDAGVIAQQYPNLNLPQNIKGAIITAVAAGGPADKAGLKIKDVITAVDGKNVDSSSGLIKTLLSYKSGDQVKLTVLRDGKELSVSVKLATQAMINPQTQNGSGTNP